MKCPKNGGKTCPLCFIKRIFPFSYLCWWREETDRPRELNCFETRALRKRGKKDAKGRANADKRAKNVQGNKQGYYATYVQFIKDDFLNETGIIHNNYVAELSNLNKKIRNYQADASKKLEDTKLQIVRRHQTIKELSGEVPMSEKNRKLIDVQEKLNARDIKDCGEFLVECNTSGKNCQNEAKEYWDKYISDFEKDVRWFLQKAGVYWEAFHKAYIKYGLDYDSLCDGRDVLERELRESNKSPIFQVEPYKDIIPSPRDGENTVADGAIN